MAAVSTHDDGREVLCVFAKPPVPGRSKTRLATEIGNDRAAELARAFVLDTWAAVSAVEWARPVLATTEHGTAHALGLAAEEWIQGDGDLGNRMERVLGRALEGGASCAIAIGADTPGLPRRLLDDAHRALARADAVLGPSEDGGFYLIGLRRCPPGLLAGLPWSRSNTFLRTLARFRTFALRTEVLLPWFDVDRPRDLDLLEDLLALGELRAPNTARVLSTARRRPRRRQWSGWQIDAARDAAWPAVTPDTTLTNSGKTNPKSTDENSKPGRVRASRRIASTGLLPRSHGTRT